MRETHLPLSLTVTQGTCVPILALPRPSKVTRQKGTQQGLDRKMQLYIFLRHHEKPVEKSAGHGGDPPSLNTALVTLSGPSAKPRSQEISRSDRGCTHPGLLSSKSHTAAFPRPERRRLLVCSLPHTEPFIKSRRAKHKGNIT